MKVIVKPTREQKVLSSVKKGASAEEIYRGIIEKAECCVVHLCGCGPDDNCFVEAAELKTLHRARKKKN